MAQTFEKHPYGRQVAQMMPTYLHRQYFSKFPLKRHYNDERNLIKNEGAIVCLSESTEIGTIKQTRGSLAKTTSELALPHHAPPGRLNLDRFNVHQSPLHDRFSVALGCWNVFATQRCNIDLFFVDCLTPLLCTRTPPTYCDDLSSDIAPKPMAVRNPTAGFHPCEPETRECNSRCQERNRTHP
ncbi:hypothetical protein TNCV_536191 [Trichonephila clavipes]|nr:hypothetical protein TNCV_536191 [Trichonephila clavipes]